MIVLTKLIRASKLFLRVFSPHSCRYHVKKYQVTSCWEWFNFAIRGMINVRASVFAWCTPLCGVESLSSRWIIFAQPVIRLADSPFLLSARLNHQNNFSPDSQQTKLSPWFKAKFYSFPVFPNHLHGWWFSERIAELDDSTRFTIATKTRGAKHRK